MTETLPVDGRSLSLEQFLEVVRGRRGVSISSGAAAAVRSSRNAVERVVDAGRPVYGISTGFGALSDRTVPREKLRELQASLIRSHASGTGPALPADLVRGVMLLRLNSLARGLSGVRIEVVERLADLLNHGLVPMIPEQGSVGASGDLAPLAHLALALTGEGAFVDERTRTVLPARDVLRSEGIQPLVLAEKEGVALLNGTSLMAAYLALGVADARELLDVAMVAAAVSFDALLGAPESLDDRLGEIRNSPDHREVARARSGRCSTGADSRYPTRSGRARTRTLSAASPRSLGPFDLAIGFAEGVALRELDAVTDNPVVFEGDEFVNGGNFHGQPLAFALDALALAIQYIAGFSERRTVRLVHPSLSRGLPPFLAPEPGLSSGFMVPQ